MNKKNTGSLAEEGLTREVIDSIANAIVVLDARGAILQVNSAWRHFGCPDGAAVGAGEGDNYLDLCRQAADRDTTAGRILAGLEGVLAGDLASFALEYACHCPDEARWYQLEATPLGRPEGGLVISHLDISLRRRAEEEIRRLNGELARQVAERTAEMRLAASVVQHTGEGAIVTDIDGVILSVNPAFTEITGYTPAEAIGKTPRLLRSRHHEPEFYRRMWASLVDKGHWYGEIWNRRKNGEAYLERLTINAIQDEQGRTIRYVAVFNDITEVRRKDERIRHLVHHDPLTGLPNRLLLEDRLHHALSMARREKERLALLFIDLDRFKAVNDSLGHNVGDALLEQVAGRLADCVAPSDTVARLGGDEFMILLEGVGSPQDCAALARKILSVLGEHRIVGGHTIQTGASIGIALFPDDGEDGVALMKNADAAMYAAKAAGRGAYRFFQPAMTARAVQRLTLEMDLRYAADRGELLLHYQPKISARNRRLCGFEALVRWRHRDLGLISPADFIPIAEECGLIGDIGDWVLTETCRQLAEWRSKGWNPPAVAINVSAKQLQERSLAARIHAVAGNFGLPPALLEVELTESGVMGNPEQAAEAFREMTAIGVRVAVDDFGTGYSSFAYLRRLPIDVLKIDRSFVMDAERNQEDAEIVATIIALGKTLGLTVVAEGVESEGQAALLQAAGCDQFQGYLFARPQPPEEIEERWLPGKTAGAPGP